MSLYAKVVVLLCALFATTGPWTMSSSERSSCLVRKLEADLARTDMERARRAIERELDQLQTFSADWGNWLDTYQYMAGENPAFIEENMTPVTLEAAGLDLSPSSTRKDDSCGERDLNRPRRTTLPTTCSRQPVSMRTTRS